MKELLKEGDIRREWAWIRDPIARILAGTGEGYQPEDIYAGCLLGDCRLMIGDGCFLIYRTYQRPLIPVKVLSVWLGHTENPSGNFPEEVLPLMDRVAETQGCQQVEFCSTRRGFTRKHPETMTPTMQTFVHLTGSLSG